jgi:hypothetical protein
MHSIHNYAFKHELVRSVGIKWIYLRECKNSCKVNTI